MAIRRTPETLQSPGSASPPAPLAQSGPAKSHAMGPLKKPASLEKAAPKAASADKPAALKKRAAPRKSQTLIGARAAPPVSEDERRGMIALSAYLRGEKRGFAPGGEREDWIAAEKEVDALLSGGHGPAQ